MKTKLIITLLFMVIFSAFTLAQNVYVNTCFEKTDTSGKSILQWQTNNNETEYTLDSTIKASGKYSLYFETIFSDSTGQTFSFNLPKSCFKSMRNINISLKIREMGYTSKAGLWCKVKKDKKLIGWKSTYKGQLAFPMDINKYMIAENNTIMRMAWTTYSFDINVKDDPDEVIIGGFSILTAWFDDIQITIDGKAIDNLVIPMKFDSK